jgi:hypothetical protein
MRSAKRSSPVTDVWAGVPGADQNPAHASLGGAADPIDGDVGITDRQ